MTIPLSAKVEVLDRVAIIVGDGVVLESQINSMLQILGSHETVKRVVNDIGPDVIIANSISSSGAPAKKETPSWSLRDWISDLKSSIIKNEFEYVYYCILFVYHV